MFEQLVGVLLGWFRRCDLDGGNMPLGMGFDVSNLCNIHSEFSLLAACGSRHELTAIPATIPACCQASSL